MKQKPHLFVIGHLWRCAIPEGPFFDGKTGFGMSPANAYRDWLKGTTIFVVKKKQWAA